MRMFITYIHEATPSRLRETTVLNNIENMFQTK